MRKLISSADVLVQNFRPGTMERLGFGGPALRELNPRLIYVSISGVGESGSYAKKRVYETASIVTTRSITGATAQ